MNNSIKFKPKIQVISSNEDFRKETNLHSLNKATSFMTSSKISSSVFQKFIKSENNSFSESVKKKPREKLQINDLRKLSFSSKSSPISSQKTPILSRMSQMSVRSESKPILDDFSRNVLSVSRVFHKVPDYGNIVSIDKIEGEDLFSLSKVKTYDEIQRIPDKGQRNKELAREYRRIQKMSDNIFQATVLMKEDIDKDKKYCSISNSFQSELTGYVEEYIFKSALEEYKKIQRSISIYCEKLNSITDEIKDEIYKLEMWFIRIVREQPENSIREKNIWFSEETYKLKNNHSIHCDSYFRGYLRKCEKDEKIFHDLKCILFKSGIPEDILLKY